MDMREGLKQSCDVYFYEVARKLGIDRLSETAKKFGLEDRVLDGFIEERTGVVPNTSWKKKFIGKNWYLGETLHAGIGQGYWQSSPMQLCLMTAQIANGGYKIKPRIILNDDENKKFSDLNKFIEDRKLFSDDVVSLYDFISKFKYKSLFRNPENIKFVIDALYGATNEPGGTSYGSRLTKKGFIFAGKTGTSQVKRFTAEQRELKLKMKTCLTKIEITLYLLLLHHLKILGMQSVLSLNMVAPVARPQRQLLKKLLKKFLERHPLRESQANGEIV